MKIVLTIEGGLHESALEVPDGTTLEQLLDNLNPDADPDDLAIRVNYKPAVKSHILHAGDRVRIVPKERNGNQEV